MKIIGKIHFILGLSGLVHWYIGGELIGESQTILIMYGWLFFQGIYCMSSETNIVEIGQGELSYKNLVAISCIYFFLVVIFSGWREILLWRFSNPGPFNLSHMFAAMPANNLSWLPNDRLSLVTKTLRVVYSTGYLLPLFVPVFASILRRRYEKAWQYLLSGHVLQILLVTPIYMLIQVEEVWYISGMPDPMLRTFYTHIEQQFMVSWCFPSMHTSIAVASLLVALQEPYRFFKWFWCTYCVVIIISTIWLGIHWTIDVVAGIGVAFVAVYGANCIVFSLWFQRTFLSRMQKKYSLL